MADPSLPIPAAGLAAAVKVQARALGADLVGITSAAVLNAHPPDPEYPKTPAAIFREYGQSVVIVARRML